MQEDDNMTLIPATISGHDEYNDYQPAIAEGDRKTQIENKLIEYSTPLGILRLISDNLFLLLTNGSKV